MWCHWSHGTRGTLWTWRATLLCHLHHRAGLLQVLADWQHGRPDGHPGSWRNDRSAGEAWSHLLLFRVHHGLSHVLLLLLHSKLVLHVHLLLLLELHLWWSMPADDILRKAWPGRHLLLLLLHVRLHLTTVHHWMLLLLRMLIVNLVRSGNAHWRLLWRPRSVH